MPLGKVLAKQSVEVLVAAAFPEMMWIREVADHRESVLELLVGMEFGAVVERECPEHRWLGRYDLGHSLNNQACRAVRKLCKAGLRCHTLNHGQDALMAILAHDRVDLPMADLTTGLDTGRAFGNEPFTLQSAPGIAAAIPFSPSFGHYPEIPEQHAAIVSPSLFRPDILSKERGNGRATAMDSEAQI